MAASSILLVRSIVGAEITIVNDATRVQYASKTDGEGIYVVTNLPPGAYRLQVAKQGIQDAHQAGHCLERAGLLGDQFYIANRRGWPTR